MGYNLHITRKKNDTDDPGPDITAAEWLAVLDMKMNPVHPANPVNPVEFPPLAGRNESLPPQNASARFCILLCHFAF